MIYQPREDGPMFNYDGEKFFPTLGDEMKSLVGSIGIMSLDQTLAEGGTIEIPSMNIGVKQDSEGKIITFELNPGEESGLEEQ